MRGRKSCVWGQAPEAGQAALADAGAGNLGGEFGKHEGRMGAPGIDTGGMRLHPRCRIESRPIRKRRERDSAAHCRLLSTHGRPNDRTNRGIPLPQGQPDRATAATRYMMPDPAHRSPAYGQPTPKAASTCSIGRCGRNDGLLPDRSGRPNSPSIGHSSSSPRKTSSGLTANPVPSRQKCPKPSLEYDFGQVLW